MLEKYPNNVFKELLVLLILQPFNIVKLGYQVTDGQAHHILAKLQPQVFYFA